MNILRQIFCFFCDMFLFARYSYFSGCSLNISLVIIFFEYILYRNT
ncbi:Uncharacterised protein [Mycobacterium tuberculosis]|nr:Uncharacterised protein [Mycobacterium tuberculosis]